MQPDMSTKARHGGDTSNPLQGCLVLPVHLGIAKRATTKKATPSLATLSAAMRFRDPDKQTLAARNLCCPTNNFKYREHAPRQKQQQGHTPSCWFILKGHMSTKGNNKAATLPLGIAAKASAVDWILTREHIARNPIPEVGSGTSPWMKVQSFIAAPSPPKKKRTLEPRVVHAKRNCSLFVLWGTGSKGMEV